MCAHSSRAISKAITRGALSTTGPAKSNFLSVTPVIVGMISVVLSGLKIRYWIATQR